MNVSVVDTPSNAATVLPPGHTRIDGHGRRGGGAARYRVKRLVWFEEYYLVTDAIRREKIMKKWPRQWKINLIEQNNPEWQDIAWQLL